MSNKKKEFDPYWLTLALLAVLVLGAVYISETDLRKDAELYCKQVRDGVWPDYRQDYATDCRQTYGPATHAKPR